MQYISFSHYRLAYSFFGETEGETAVLLLHEGLGSIAQWRDLPEKLFQILKIPVVAYERAGYGNSYPKKQDYSPLYLENEALKILPEFIHQLPFKNYYLIGHSDGATIALIYASIYPEKVKSLVAIAPHVFVEDVTVEGIKWILPKKHILIEKLKKYHGENATEIFSRWSQVWLSENFRDWEIYDYIKKLETPSLLIQAADDEYATFKQLDKIHALHKGTCHELRLVQGGHSPHFSQKEIILQAIKDFFGENLKSVIYR